MFKSARWRSEKNKIKSVFKLQFHATQLKHVAGDALIISIVPADTHTGKPTTRLEKAKITDGSCYWEKPHYETVKFVHDPKTGKLHEKIYTFVVSTGSSKSSGVGEVSIDFSIFAEATKSSSLCLPVKNANCSAFLHVSIQRIQDSLEQREIDGSENANRHERTLRAQLSNNDKEDTITTKSTEVHRAAIDNQDRQGSSGSDITLSASDISSGLETLRELEPETGLEPKNTKLVHEPLTTTVYEKQHVSQWDWLDGSPTELSTDDSLPSPREPVLDEDTSPEAIIKKLKTELEILVRQADVTELELQTLRKQIVKERKKGLELSREVNAVTEERNALKEECEKLKENIRCTEKTEVKVKGDPWDVVEELRQELNHEKDLNSDLRLQLQKTQEANAELILAVRDLDAMLEHKESKSKSKSETDEDEDEDQKALEDIVREHSGMQEARFLEQKLNDLYGEIESYKRDKDELEMQIDQISLDYEILKQGNHDMCYKLEQSQLQEQLNYMQYECTDAVNQVNELETQIESLKHELKLKSEKLSDLDFEIEELKNIIKNLEKDLEDQAQGFEADIKDLVNAKVKHEQRAIHAEESLRKMKLQNVKTAERLQEEFWRLSKQMNSSFEANEKVAMKAMDEANKLRVEKRILEETVKKVKQDIDFLNVSYEKRLADLSSQISQKSKELEKMEKQVSAGDEMALLKSLNKSMEVELIEMQERYSEISLKFAEVEGERQQLVMTLRNLKNAKKF